MRVPGLRRGIGHNTRQAREGRYNEHAETVTKALASKLDDGDIGADGKFKRGNSRDWYTEVTFRRADQDTFVEHGLGYICENWTVKKKSGPGDIYDGQRRPEKTGLWLRCSVAGTKARIKVSGQRKQGFE